MSVTDIAYDDRMGRWEPDGRRRLQQAALELYAERGFERTTAAEIAARAGLTERTFFRHFGDKREVLFGNEAALQELLATTVAEASAELSPLAAIAAGLDAVAGRLQPRREELRSREAIVVAHPELRERELIKLASWSLALADALGRRGIAQPAARLSAEVAIAVLRVASERWLAADEEPAPLQQLVREGLAQLERLAAGR